MTQSTSIPWRAEDLNKDVKLNLILSNHTSFQTMHIEVTETFSYCIIAKFNGEPEDDNYALHNIDFKFIKVHGIEDYYKIANIVKTEEDEIIKFELTIEPFRLEEGETEVQFLERIKTHTYKFDSKILVNPQSILDIHMTEQFYDLMEHQLIPRGRQCNSFVYF